MSYAVSFVRLSINVYIQNGISYFVTLPLESLLLPLEITSSTYLASLREYSSPVGESLESLPMLLNMETYCLWRIS